MIFCDQSDTFSLASLCSNGSGSDTKYPIAIDYLRDPFLLDHLTLALIHPTKQLPAPQHGRTAKLLAFACGTFYKENPEIGKYYVFYRFFIKIILFMELSYFYFYYIFIPSFDSFVTESSLIFTLRNCCDYPISNIRLK